MAEPATATSEQRLNIEELRAAVRQIAVGFPDAYWSDHDQTGEFPWEFYDAFARDGWLGIAIPDRRRPRIAIATARTHGGHT
jgi:alkylation response protein AidB-like acyl-CoA dehydrogenase